MPDDLLARADAALRDVFRLPGWRPGQREVVAALLAGRNALAVFPTGGGKSLCYQLPSLLLDGTTVVVSPLVALMKDQLDALGRLGVPAARLDSSLGLDEARDVASRLRGGTLRLLYVAPERVNNERFLRDLGEARIAMMAVDEAHCISEWGHNFRPDYLKLVERARELGVGRLLALTATATPAVQADIRRAMGVAEDDAVATGFHRPNLLLLTTPVTGRERDAVLLDRLRTRPPGPTIVYVTLQRTAVAVAERLAEAGLPARPYHAGLDAEVRAATQDWWSTAPDGIVVATVAFGMGIDRADVRYVYHRDQPKSVEAYAQEIGRAGRDGAPSTCELLACADDAPVLESFAYGDTPEPRALGALLDRVLAAPDGRFDLAESSLAGDLDVRPLVLRTALTYLELDGIVRQGTPFYASYRVRPLADLDAVAAALPPEPGGFLRDVLAAGRAGRTWVTVAPDDAAAALGAPRDRVVRALDWLAAQGHAEVAPAEVRQRYELLRVPDDPAAVVRGLAHRFSAREAADVARVRAVMALATGPSCRWNALAATFGEERDAPCGHCSWCLDGSAAPLPPARVPPPLPDGVDEEALAALVQEHPLALGTARQQARFLCGLPSPAVARARLGRSPLMGALDRHPFADVLAWRVASGAPAPVT